MKLDGRVALVTGAQQGIGRATAEALGHAGASVIVNFLDDHEAALQVVESIQECGSSAKAVKGDVGLRPDCEEMMAAGGLWGGVDLLINNAGISK